EELEAGMMPYYVRDRTRAAHLLIPLEDGEGVEGSHARTRLACGPIHQALERTVVDASLRVDVDHVHGEVRAAVHFVLADDGQIRQVDVVSGDHYFPNR